MYCNQLLVLGFISLFILSGCQSSSGGGGTKSKANCADSSTVKLDSKNVKDIVLTDKLEKYSSTAANSQAIGYKFVGKKGQKINYQIPNGFCSWLYTSDNKILNDPILPQNDTYLLQIAAGENSGTFDLSMSLGDNKPSPETPTPTPSPTPSPPEPTPTVANTNEPSKDEARNIINQWLEAKKGIFGASYDKSLGEKLTIGQAYERNIQAKPGEEESSVDDLKKNGQYWTFELQELHDIKSIEPIGSNSNEALVKAVVTEHRTLHSSKGRSKPVKNNRDSVCYLLQKDGDAWKISKDPSLLTSCN